MKLIFCKECNDIVKVAVSNSYCTCKGSGGHFLGSENVVLFGVGILLDLNESELKSIAGRTPKFIKPIQAPVSIIPPKDKTVIHAVDSYNK